MFASENQCLEDDLPVCWEALFSVVEMFPSNGILQVQHPNGWNYITRMNSCYIFLEGKYNSIFLGR